MDHVAAAPLKRERSQSGSEDEDAERARRERRARLAAAKARRALAAGAACAPAAAPRCGAAALASSAAAKARVALAALRGRGGAGDAAVPLDMFADAPLPPPAPRSPAAAVVEAASSAASSRAASPAVTRAAAEKDGARDGGAYEVRPGEYVSRYRVESALGKGVFATVVKALDVDALRLRKPASVALKLCRRDAHSGAAGEREAACLGRLKGSPCVVDFFGSFEWRGHVVLALACWQIDLRRAYKLAKGDANRGAHLGGAALSFVANVAWRGRRRKGDKGGLRGTAQRERRAITVPRKKHPYFETLKGDAHSSRDEPKGVETDRERRLLEARKRYRFSGPGREGSRVRFVRVRRRGPRAPRRQAG